MYTPPVFRMDDLPEMHEVIRRVRLATLVTATDQGLLATSLPEASFVLSLSAARRACWALPVRGRN